LASAYAKMVGENKLFTPLTPRGRGVRRRGGGTPSLLSFSLYFSV